MKKFILIIMMVISLNLASAQFVKINGDLFDRADNDNLGSNWTEHDALGATNWHIHDNSLEADATGSNQDYVYFNQISHLVNANVSMINIIFVPVEISSSNYQYQIRTTDSTTEGIAGASCYVTQSDVLQCQNSSTQVSLINPVSAGTAYNITWRNMNGSHYDVVIDGTDYGRFRYQNLGQDQYLSFFHKNGAANTHVKWDNLSIYNGSYSAPVSPNPTLTLNWNLQDTSNYNHEHLNISYNGSFTDNTIDICNCSFFANGVLNQSHSNVNLSNTYFFNFSTYLTEKNYTFQLNCTNFEVNDSTTPVLYKIDSLDPRMSVTFTNNSNYEIPDVVSFNYSITDNNLFAINETWIDPNNAVVYNRFVTNLTNISQTTYANTTTYGPSTSGLHTIKLDAWDSHTSKVIKDKTITDISLNNVSGYSYNGVNILADNIKSKDTNKKLDRYEFSFEYDKKLKEEKTLIVQGQGLYKLYDSKYGYYLIDWNSKQWIDFVSDQVHYVDLHEISQYEYHVKFKLKDNVTSVKFKSIGDMNYLGQVYYFNVSTGQNITIQYHNITNLYIFEDEVKTIANGIFFIPLVMLYLGFLTLSFTLIHRKSYASGLLLGIMTLFFDLLFMVMIYDMFDSSNGGYWYGTVLSSSSGWQLNFLGIFIASMLLWIFAKIGVYVYLRIEKR